jgi:hypothetical protein
MLTTHGTVMTSVNLWQKTPCNWDDKTRTEVMREISSLAGIGAPTAHALFDRQTWTIFQREEIRGDEFFHTDTCAASNTVICYGNRNLKNFMLLPSFSLSTSYPVFCT